MYTDYQGDYEPGKDLYGIHATPMGLAVIDQEWTDAPEGA